MSIESKTGSQGKSPTVNSDLDPKQAIRVLHVDDNLAFLRTAKQCLEVQGHFHVDVDLSDEQALQKLKREEYDIVVSDYHMPRKDGLQFLKELRGEGNNIPFVMFTGKGKEEVTVGR